MRHAVEEAEHGRRDARQDHVRQEEQHLDGHGLHVMLPLARRARPLEDPDAHDDGGDKKRSNSHQEQLVVEREGGPEAGERQELEPVQVEHRHALGQRLEGLGEPNRRHDSGQRVLDLVPARE